jgi:DNA-directed RNA polymerase subunit RPC12/RpoP
VSDHLPTEIACPYCSSTQTELESLFGRQLLTVQYYCRACFTPFERVKGDDVLEDAAHSIEQDRTDH